MLSFFSLNMISNAHFLFKNTLFVLYLQIYKGWTNVSVTYSKEMLLFTTYVFTEMILHSSYFLLSYKVLFFKKWLFLLCENWWYFTIDLISQHTIIESFENRSETSSNMSSWFNVWFSSYFTLSILHVPPYKM